MRAIVFVENENVERVCSEIAKKDKNFKYELCGGNILLTDSDRDSLHRKAMWMSKKVRGVKGYQVIE